LDIKGIGEKVERESVFVDRILAQMRRAIVGQEELVRGLIMGLLANGHVLLEGVPGLAKTRSVRALSKCIRAGFQRIQFTPDLLPADLVGTLIYVAGEGGFRVRKGPIFTNIVLADEINRAPAKVQSALLEAMQERAVTIGDTTHPLPAPFIVLATQNPIEQEGTYPLPEAQVDRFLLKVVVRYPSRAEERKILDLASAEDSEAMPAIEPVVSPEEIVAVRRVVDEIYVDDKIKEYVIDLVQETRAGPASRVGLTGLVDFGASPRATLGLVLCAKVNAFMAHRAYVTPQDVKDVAKNVLRHRILLSFEAEAEELTPDAVVDRLLDGVKVP
jgi:MoxR-like ATPase